MNRYCTIPSPITRRKIGRLLSERSSVQNDFFPFRLPRKPKALLIRRGLILFRDFRKQQSFPPLLFRQNRRTHPHGKGLPPRYFHNSSALPSVPQFLPFPLFLHCSQSHRHESAHNFRFSIRSEKGIPPPEKGGKGKNGFHPACSFSPRISCSRNARTCGTFSSSSCLVYLRSETVSSTSCSQPSVPAACPFSRTSASPSP